MDDVGRYRKLFAPIEVEAKDQRWANERPWTVATHVWSEDGVPVIDLHDLGAGIAKRLVHLLVDRPPAAGAVVLVHGRGRHSSGAGAVLGKIVAQELGMASVERPGASVRAIGSGRTAWVTDAKRAPRSVSGAWGVGTWAGWVGLLGAIATAVGHALGLW